MSRVSPARPCAYRFDHTPAPDEIKAIAATWAPHRTWVTLSLRRPLEDEMGELGGER